MKSNFLMAIAIVVTSLTINAQPQRMQPYSGVSSREGRQQPRVEFSIPGVNLNDGQREEIRKIRLEQLKESTQTSSLLKEKRARLETLQTADKPDTKEINKVIDEIALMQAKEMKAQAAVRQKIRSLLTEEQRTLFDARGGFQGNYRPDFRAMRPNDRQMRPNNWQRRPNNWQMRPNDRQMRRNDRPVPPWNERSRRISPE